MIISPWPWQAKACTRRRSSTWRSGGLGFTIGDGRLNYGHEQILEAYYRFERRSARAARSDSFSAQS